MDSRALGAVWPPKSHLPLPRFISAVLFGHRRKDTQDSRTRLLLRPRLDRRAAVQAALGMLSAELWVTHGAAFSAGGWGSTSAMGGVAPGHVKTSAASLCKLLRYLGRPILVACCLFSFFSRCCLSRGLVARPTGDHLRFSSASRASAFLCLCSHSLPSIGRSLGDSNGQGSLDARTPDGASLLDTRAQCTTHISASLPIVEECRVKLLGARRRQG